MGRRADIPTAAELAAIDDWLFRRWPTRAHVDAAARAEARHDLAMEALEVLHGPPQSERGLNGYRRRLHWLAAEARVRGGSVEDSERIARGEVPVAVRARVEGGPLLWEVRRG